jgi:hypothetical protein
MKRRIPLVALLGALVASCGAGHDHGGTDGGVPTSDGAIGCQMDTRGETYVANLEHMGSGGKLRFILVSSDPAPPAKGNNTWMLKVLDTATGSPMTGATLMIKPFMPDHGHGTSVVPTITPMGEAYELQKVNLFMAGLWEVTVTAQAGAMTDFSIFRFCIPG